MILNYGVPDILCKLAHNKCVCVIFLVSNCTDSFQNGLQLVFDFFKINVKYSEAVLTSSREGVDELFTNEPGE